mmetsp:Transcript_91706/g.213303  ORF Transcript_91706/g.213303 Transcript_91706/m.213303 type:complete len:96 (-) Transcript_91706:171-458(-)
MNVQEQTCERGAAQDMPPDTLLGYSMQRCCQIDLTELRPMLSVNRQNFVNALTGNDLFVEPSLDRTLLTVAVPPESTRLRTSLATDSTPPRGTGF